MCIDWNDIKEGMVLFECSSGQNFKFTVVSPARLRPNDGTEYRFIVGRTDSGKEVEIGYDTTYGRSYMPKIYRQPQYVRIENGIPIAIDDCTGNQINLETS